MLTSLKLRLTLTVISLTLISALAARGVRAEPLPVWSKRGMLVPPNGGGGEYFGAAVAISGDTAVVGNPGGVGKVWAFARAGSSWLVQGGALGSQFSGGSLGYPCAVFADTVMCGDGSKGTAYAFERTAGIWSTGERLVPTDSNFKDWTNMSLSVYGDTALVGVPLRIAMGGSFNPTAVYVFQRNSAGWVQQTKLSFGYHPVGFSVAIFEHTFAYSAVEEDDGLGGLGLVYLYERTDAGWQQAVEPLHQPDGYAMSYFGMSISLDKDTLVASGKHLTVDGAAAGAAYVFVRKGGSWSLQGALEPAEPDESFANTVSVSGDTVAIAAKSKTYFFGRAAGHWEQLGPPLLGSLGPLYHSVSISGQYAIAGVIGAAYVYSDACGIDTDCPATAYCLTGTCRARCQHDSECPSGSFCPAVGVCAPQQATGLPCDDTTTGGCREPGCDVCSSGHCVDSVCCESTCDGTCEACSAPLTGGVEGACLPIPSGQDPQDECASGQGLPSPCLADGLCDGHSACDADAKSGTACGETTCGAQGVAGHVCDGNGTCHTDTVSCVPYTCAGNACATQCALDGDCDSATSYCRDGACIVKKSPGEVCRGDVECAGDRCADGTCCESREACTHSGGAGAGGAGDVSDGGAGDASGGGSGGSCEGTTCGQPAGTANEPDGGSADVVANDANSSATSCGCRVAGSSALGASRGLLPLLSLMLLGARRRRSKIRHSPIHRFHSRHRE